MLTDASRAGKQNTRGEVVVGKTLGWWQERDELQDAVVKSLPLGVNWRSIVLILGSWVGLGIGILIIILLLWSLNMSGN